MSNDRQLYKVSTKEENENTDRFLLLTEQIKKPEITKKTKKAKKKKQKSSLESSDGNPLRTLRTFGHAGTTLWQPLPTGGFVTTPARDLGTGKSADDRFKSAAILLEDKIKKAAVPQKGKVKKAIKKPSLGSTGEEPRHISISPEEAKSFISFSEKSNSRLGQIALDLDLNFYHVISNDDVEKFKCYIQLLQKLKKMDSLRYLSIPVPGQITVGSLSLLDFAHQCEAEGIKHYIVENKASFLVDDKTDAFRPPHPLLRPFEEKWHILASAPYQIDSYVSPTLFSHLRIIDFGKIPIYWSKNPDDGTYVTRCNENLVTFKNEKSAVNFSKRYHGLKSVVDGLSKHQVSLTKDNFHAHGYRSFDQNFVALENNGVRLHLALHMRNIIAENLVSDFQLVPEILQALKEIVPNSCYAEFHDMRIDVVVDIEGTENVSYCLTPWHGKAKPTSAKDLPHANEIYIIADHELSADKKTIVESVKFASRTKTVSGNKFTQGHLSLSNENKKIILEALRQNRAFNTAEIFLLYNDAKLANLGFALEKMTVTFSLLEFAFYIGANQIIDYIKSDAYSHDHPVPFPCSNDVLAVLCRSSLSADIAIKHLESWNTVSPLSAPFLEAPTPLSYALHRARRVRQINQCKATHLAPIPDERMIDNVIYLYLENAYELSPLPASMEEGKAAPEKGKLYYKISRDHLSFAYMAAGMTEPGIITIADLGIVPTPPVGGEEPAPPLTDEVLKNCRYPILKITSERGHTAAMNLKYKFKTGDGYELSPMSSSMERGEVVPEKGKLYYKISEDHLSFTYMAAGMAEPGILTIADLGIVPARTLTGQVLHDYKDPILKITSKRKHLPATKLKYKRKTDGYELVPLPTSMETGEAAPEKGKLYCKISEDHLSFTYMAAGMKRPGIITIGDLGIVPVPTLTGEVLTNYRYPILKITSGRGHTAAMVPVAHFTLNSDSSPYPDIIKARLFNDQIGLADDCQDWVFASAAKSNRHFQHRHESDLAIWMIEQENVSMAVSPDMTLSNVHYAAKVVNTFMFALQKHIDALERDPQYAFIEKKDGLWLKRSDELQILFKHCADALSRQLHKDKVSNYKNDVASTLKDTLTLIFKCQTMLAIYWTHKWQCIIQHPAESMDIEMEIDLEPLLKVIKNAKFLLKHPKNYYNVIWERYPANNLWEEEVCGVLADPLDWPSLISDLGKAEAEVYALFYQTPDKKDLETNQYIVSGQDQLMAVEKKALITQIRANKQASNIAKRIGDKENTLRYLELSMTCIRRHRFLLKENDLGNEENLLNYEAHEINQFIGKLVDRMKNKKLPLITLSSYFNLFIMCNIISHEKLLNKEEDAYKKTFKETILDTFIKQSDPLMELMASQVKEYEWQARQYCQLLDWLLTKCPELVSVNPETMPHLGERTVDFFEKIKKYAPLRPVAATVVNRVFDKLIVLLNGHGFNIVNHDIRKENAASPSTLGIFQQGTAEKRRQPDDGNPAPSKRQHVGQTVVPRQ